MIFSRHVARFHRAIRADPPLHFLLFVFFVCCFFLYCLLVRRDLGLGPRGFRYCWAICRLCTPLFLLFIFIALFIYLIVFFFISKHTYLCAKLSSIFFLVYILYIFFILALVYFIALFIYLVYLIAFLFIYSLFASLFILFIFGNYNVIMVVP
jgi:hypothetical protein